jgi:ABC-type antimicrobial peptide transport system permease subunit
VNTSVQVGGAIMLAVVTAIVTSSRAVVAPGALPGGVDTAIMVISGLSIVAMVYSVVLIAVKRRRRELVATD